jgi:hypothetical protein
MPYPCVQWSEYELLILSILYSYQKQKYTNLKLGRPVNDLFRYASTYVFSNPILFFICGLFPISRKYNNAITQCESIYVNYSSR